MSNLFFVSVAVGILSGTSISVKAQTSVNIEKFGPSTAQPKFIEGLEIKTVPTDVVKPVKQLFKTSRPLSAAKKAAGSSDFANNIELCSPLQFKYAQLMNVDVETIANSSLYNFIEEWWSVRYRYGGTTKKGVDCSSFTGQLVQNVYNLQLPRTAGDQYNSTQRLNREDLLEGDLVFFNTRGGISHVGFYLGNNYFVHSSSHSGVTISSLDDEYYNKKYIGGGRVTEPETTTSTEEVVLK